MPPRNAALGQQCTRLAAELSSSDAHTFLSDQGALTRSGRVDPAVA